MSSIKLQTLYSKFMITLLTLQLTIFILVAVGFLMKKIHIIGPQGQKNINDLVIYLILPCNILHAFTQSAADGDFTNYLEILLISIGIQVFCVIYGKLMFRGEAEGRYKCLQYGTICSNAGILGNPIAEGIFGQMGMMYASIYVIPQRIFMWSVGLTYFTEAPDKKTLCKKVATHPCILSVLIGFLLMVTQIRLPEVLNVTIKTVAGANTFLAMALVGLILSKVKLTELVERDTIYYAFIRLVFVPLLVYIGCRLASVDDLVTGVSVVLAAMPAASVTAVMASKYKKDEAFATKCVVFTTLLSLVTVPVWCLFLV